MTDTLDAIEIQTLLDPVETEPAQQLSKSSLIDSKTHPVHERLPTNSSTVQTSAAQAPPSTPSQAYSTRQLSLRVQTACTVFQWAFFSVAIGSILLFPFAFSRDLSGLRHTWDEYRPGVTTVHAARLALLASTEFNDLSDLKTITWFPDIDPTPPLPPVCSGDPTAQDWTYTMDQPEMWSEWAVHSFLQFWNESFAQMNARTVYCSPQGASPVPRNRSDLTRTVCMPCSRFQCQGCTTASCFADAVQWGCLGATDALNASFSCSSPISGARCVSSECTDCRTVLAQEWPVFLVSYKQLSIRYTTYASASVLLNERMARPARCFQEFRRQLTLLLHWIM